MRLKGIRGFANVTGARLWLGCPGDVGQIEKSMELVERRIGLHDGASGAAA